MPSYIEGAEPCEISSPSLNLRKKAEGSRAARTGMQNEERRKERRANRIDKILGRVRTCTHVVDPAASYNSGRACVFLNLDATSDHRVVPRLIFSNDTARCRA